MTEWFPGLPLSDLAEDLADEQAFSEPSAAVTASLEAHIIGVLYTGAAPNRPTTEGAFVLWNGTTDPGVKALDGDLGIGWT